MKLFIGLGNPGVKYQNNRHNVGKLFIGFLVNQLTNWQVDKLKERNKLVAEIFKKDDLVLVKLETFMNLSGIVVKKILKTLHVPRYTLYVIHDDLDIPLGKFKIQFGQGPKLHNGIKSVEENLKTKDFWRIRIGVDNRKKENWIEGEKYVLQDFLLEEKEILQTQVFLKIINKII